MGVRGLKGFIEKKPQHLIQDHRLQNTSLIIDGGNVQLLLYRQASLNPTDRILGDMVQFASLVETFLINLKRANIKPVFCFGGAKDAKGRHEKTRKQHKRALETFQKIKSFPDDHGSLDQVLLVPLNCEPIFKSHIVQHEMEIHFFMFEADAEIARLSDERGGPVLSRDSDFFLMNLEHGVISFEPRQFLSPNPECYVTCELFKQAHFVLSYPGLDRRCLPLLGVCLGNYFESLEALSERILSSYRPDLSGTFKRVTANATGRPNRGHERIYKFIHFLSHKTPESAIDEITQGHGGDIKQTIIDGKEFYEVPASTTTSQRGNFAGELEKLFERQKIDGITSEKLDEISKYLLECLEKFTCSRVILEILNENTIFMSPTLEDLSRPHSTRACTYKIMGVFMRLLRLSESDSKAMTVYDRKGSGYVGTLVEEIEQLENFGNIEQTLQDLPGLSQGCREKLLLATFNYTLEQMQSGWDAYSGAWFEPQNLRQAQYLRLIMDFIDAAEPSNKLTSKFKRAVFTNFLFHIKDRDETLQGREDNDDSSYLDYINQNMEPQRGPSSGYEEYSMGTLHQIIQLETVAFHFNQLNSLLQEPMAPIRVEQWLNSRLIYKLATVPAEKESAALHKYEKAQLAFE